MKMDTRACTPEQSTILNRVGITQTSGFCFVKENGDPEYHLYPAGAVPTAYEEKLPAYSAAELEKMLPPRLEFGTTIIYENNGPIKYVSYPGIKTTFGETEAQARANMLIWLIENKNITVREVNG